MLTALRGLLVCVALLLCREALAQQQVADPDFTASVAKPAYVSNGPKVAIDEAHNNFHTAGDRYKPFADLLRNDGYAISENKRKFEAGSLDGIAVLVIANANAGNLTDPAFAETECDVVRDWVSAGGSLLLIADHAPFGSSAANLASRFGVTMGRGWVFDRGNTLKDITTQLVFTRDNGLLGEHPILAGRDASETVKHVRAFTGQSLSIPEGATPLLKLSPTAREAPLTDDLNAEAEAIQSESSTAGSRSASVAGRAQGIATPYGKGRVVMLGEAALFSAQVATIPNGNQTQVIKVGMNVPGTDDKQFALNVMHWLSGLLK